MREILKVQNLKGGYRLRSPLFNELSFEIKEKELVGLIGWNGAGKTTLIQHIIGRKQPFSGTIHLMNKKLDSFNGGYIAETPHLFQHLTVYEHLELTAASHKMSREQFNNRLRELMTRFRMENNIYKYPSDLSKGMAQKVMIMHTFIVAHPFVVLDEPFSGLDPVGRSALINTLFEAKESGSAILLSTHELHEAEKHCDKFILLLPKKVIIGTLEELRELVDNKEATLFTIYHNLLGLNV
jgi:ABC-2 type transport system ATP-binding protein